MNYYSSIEEALSNGQCFYLDQDAIEGGRSGGQRCPQCRKWMQSPRKRKNVTATYLYDCESCEIKDPFRRMWHQFNKSCNDDQRQLYNKWLSEVLELSGDLQFFPDGQSPKKLKLHKLLKQLPFFGN